jgi:hypothetical protein
MYLESFQAFGATRSREPQGGAPRSRSCDELEALITQHLRIATAILYVALAGELAAMGLL